MNSTIVDKVDKVIVEENGTTRTYVGKITVKQVKDTLHIKVDKQVNKFFT